MLARHRLLSLTALGVLVLIAWGWLLTGAGMGMPPGATLGPAGLADDGLAAMMPGSGPWTGAQFAVTLAMWWAMMVAMMLPSAAPTILLHARAVSHRDASARPATGAFLLGYLLVWGLFSLLATMAQWRLGLAALLSPMVMATASRWLAATILILAGLYQLSPWKDACLRQCRSPARFLSRHYRPGRAGALHMGALHGVLCVGCCWMLMALLFVGGIMNIVWIALLTLLVAAEKLLPGGRIVAWVAGAGCIAGGLWIAL